ncbi:site-specific integrase [Luteibacter sp.]|jgi:integrase|uniref:tyrosine-type recombinase/integrase n=1 Tax=Luteibacter sp. TaxID=1886636 RepID=UPI002F405598
MASIRRRGKTWFAEVYKNGDRDAKSHRTKAEAAAWALQREAELTGKKLPEKSLKEALERYAREVATTRPGERWETLRCASLARMAIAKRRIGELDASHLAEWRDERLRSVSAATVRREIAFLRSVFDVARREWRWMRINPLDDVRRPPAPPSRKRRVPAAEVDRVTMALGYDGGIPENASQRVALSFLFALETAMRSGEIVGLTWSNVSAKSVRLPKTKNGDDREVPLSRRAREILGLLPRDGETVFGLNHALRDALFRKARDRAEVENLHFHDSRAEAIWRLSKKLDVMELARMIGHRDLRSLMIYYQTTADELADQLD